MTDNTGYKRPPTSSRWKKGQSGNPSGRKRSTANLKTDLSAEMSEMIQISEGGNPRRITKQRALLKSLTASAIKGDPRAANLILNLLARVLEDAPPPTASSPVSAEDEAILAAFLARNLQTKKPTK